MQRRAGFFSIVMMLGLTAAMPAYAQYYSDGSLSEDSNLNDDSNLSVDIFAPPPVAVAPPPLPVYAVPPPPMEEYAWQPGYWRWDGYGYFWVPGTWVQAPAVGLLWTPGYWDWNGYAYAWHEGYWAEHVGYYGGINYGGGYDGRRFYGGGWNRGHYECNPAILRVVIRDSNYGSFVSFHGGPGGINLRPTQQQLAFERERHYGMTRVQMTHSQLAARNPNFWTSHNHGRPPVAATVTPGNFSSNFVAADRAGPKNPEATAHNAQVRQHPELGNGAALPVAHREPQARVVEPVRSNSGVEPAQTQQESVRPQHYYQSREPRVEMNRAEVPTAPQVQAQPMVQPVVQQPQAVPTRRAYTGPIMVAPATASVVQQPVQAVTQPIQPQVHTSQPMQQPVHVSPPVVQQPVRTSEPTLRRGSVPEAPAHVPAPNHPPESHHEHEAAKTSEGGDSHHGGDTNH